jgi:hypothetical protein
MDFKRFLLLERLTTDPGEIDKRLKKPLTKWEFAGLALALIFPVAVMALSSVELGGQQAYDFQHYLNSARGDFSFYYYAYWLLPVWSFLDSLPLWLAYLIWTTISTLAIFFACRVFGANPAFVLPTFQTFVVLYRGQFTGLLVGGLAIFWWGLTHKHWYFAGIGLIVAASKYHTGLIPALALLVSIRMSWKEHAKVFIIPAIIGIVSLVIYPLWPLAILKTYSLNPANDWGSIAIWQWIGPLALLVWVPPLMLKMSWKERVFLLFAATPLGVPYFQQTDLLIQNILPIGWLPLLGNIVFITPLFSSLIYPVHKANKILVFIPLLIYLTITIPIIAKAFKAYFIKEENC